MKHIRKFIIHREVKRRWQDESGKNQPHGGMGPGPKHGPGGPRHMMGGKPKESRATIKRLLEYMGKDKMLVVLALVFVLVFSGATLAGSYMLKPIVDQLGKTAVQVASLKIKI